MTNHRFFSGTSTDGASSAPHPQLGGCAIPRNRWSTTSITMSPSNTVRQ